MARCGWPQCKQEATKTYRRQTTDEEKDRSKRQFAQGWDWVQFLDINVCDEHAIEAGKIGTEVTS